MQAVRSPAELCAHAIAIEREAAARYSELAERMDDEGREALARAFGTLARLKAEQLEALERRSAGLALPAVPQDRYCWLDDGRPDRARRELIFRLMTPRQALAIALAAQRRAQEFFEYVAWSAADPALRALAREMAAREREHGELVLRMLDATPAPLEAALVFERQ